MIFLLSAKVSRLLPYQPVYSEEMAEKIELEEEKLRLGNSLEVCSIGECFDTQVNTLALKITF